MLLDLELDRPLRGEVADPAFRADVLAGLAQRQKAVPARWFYDRAGSELFEAITALPEYYPTRVETGLLERHSGDVAAIAGAGRAVVEFGSGSSTKTPHLLAAVAPAAYVPVDISGDFLRESAAALAERFPRIDVFPVEGDFTRPLRLPEAVAAMPKLGFFPGSTIGNFSAVAAVDLLRAMAATLGQGAMLLIGLDRVKDRHVLIPAYNDAAGVTAAFNLNLLHRINRELGGTIPVADFAHCARWVDGPSRIEMRLVARRHLGFEVAGQRFAMAAGETIHTENSHKYGSRDARLLLRAGGWEPVAEWIDGGGLFEMQLAQVAPPHLAP
jgi:L-histidine N-alpha-methyltransferase